MNDNLKETEKEYIDQEYMDELHGDENIDSFLMPDGSFNDKYIYKLSLRAEIMESLQPAKIPFSHFPVAIKNDILRKTIVGLTVIVLSSILAILKWLPISLMLAFFLISGILLYSARLRFKICGSDNIVKFEGIVTNVETLGLTKRSRYQVIQLADERKFLNVKLDYNKNMRVGLPMTIYMPKNEPIKDTQYGPMVEYIISYSFNVNSQEDDQKFREEQSISAEDYLK